MIELGAAAVADVLCRRQGHALFTRQAGSSDPCPLVDFTGGFNAFFAAAYGLPAGQTIQQKFGAAFGAPCRYLKAHRAQWCRHVGVCTAPTWQACWCPQPALLSTSQQGTRPFGRNADRDAYDARPQIHSPMIGRTRSVSLRWRSWAPLATRSVQSAENFVGSCVSGRMCLSPKFGSRAALCCVNVQMTSGVMCVPPVLTRAAR